VIELRYHRPGSLEQACELGRRFAGSGAFLAGGTELVPDYLRGRETATDLIALDALPELHGIRIDGSVLRIGALTTVAEVAASPVIADWLLALAEAARLLGSPQVRSRATIGGNFCRAVACADLPPAAIAGGARLRLVSSRGERELEASAFFTGSRRTVLEPGEVLAELLVPAPVRHSGTSFQRFALRRGMALAVVSVAARTVLDGSRIAGATVVLGATAPVPLVVAEVDGLLRGQRASADLFTRAGLVCAEVAQPISDIRGTAEFRRLLVGKLVPRALAQATARAEGRVVS